MRTHLAVTLAVALAAGAGCTKPNEAAAEPSSSATASALVGRRIDIEATGDGYSPAEIKAQKGEDLVLRFTRKTKSDCLSEVVFPTLNIKRELPVNQPVEIAIKADKPGTIPFQCGMAMVKGKIEVGS
jgi:plastocyanin domain-containing protein